MKTITWSCSYGAGTYEVSFDISKTPYRGMLPSVMTPSLLPYYSTIDDPAVVDIAKQLREQLENVRPRNKANVILALIQQNTEYVTDEERFGYDVWETPAYVLEYGTADCDGTADLCTSIAHNVGLDVVSVIITGHMCTAVNIPGAHGKCYDYEGTKYFHLETTSDVSGVGCFDRQGYETLYINRPEIPTDEFRKMLKPIKEFVK